ncbi:MAG: paraquat-inducible protein A [Opitutaceae bacterium]
MIAPGPASLPAASSHPLTCRWCGCGHRRVELAPGERARCARCASVLAQRSRFGPSVPLAFTLAGLVFAIPALLLPFVTVDRLRQEHVGFLFSGAEVLWANGMKLAAVWVSLCGFIAPVALLGTLIVVIVRTRKPGAGALDRVALRIAHALERWAMPEVCVLAVLVALTKLGSLVNVTVGPGMWCYAAMAVMLLLAWRSFEIGSAEAVPGATPH